MSEIITPIDTKWKTWAIIILVISLILLILTRPVKVLESYNVNQSNSAHVDIKTTYKPYWYFSYTSLFFLTLLSIIIAVFIYYKDRKVDYDLDTIIKALSDYSAKHDLYLDTSHDNLDIRRRVDDSFIVFVRDKHRSYIVNAITGKVKESLKTNPDNIINSDQSNKYLEKTFSKEAEEIKQNEKLEEQGLKKERY